MTLGQKLKNLIKEKGMTQEELAEQLDVSRQAVGKWVNDKGIPEVGKLIQISNIFGVSLDYLLKEEQENAVTEGGYYVSGEMLEGYLAYQKQNRKRIVCGISLLMLANIFEEPGGSIRGIMESIYWIVTLAGIALLIWQCFQTKKYQEIKNEKLIFDNKVYETFKARREQERKRCAVLMIAGFVFLVIGSYITDFLMHYGDIQVYRYNAGASILEWICDAAGLAFILWAAMSSRAESVIVRNTEGTAKSGGRRFTWVYWALPVTAIAVVVGLVSNIFSPMAPLIVLLCALLVTVCKLLLEKNDNG